MSWQVRGILGVSGSQTGGILRGSSTGDRDPRAGRVRRHVLANTAWRSTSPSPGLQTQYAGSHVPYRFFTWAFSESLSWLAQFMGEESAEDPRGALANLVLLQQFMLAEEYQLIAGSSQNLPTPVAPTLTARIAGSNETALAAAAEIYVNVTALNYFGETIKSAQANVTPTATQVVDVTITPVAGAQQYNIYMGASTTTYLMVGTSVQSGTTYTGSQTANAVGGIKFTLQGATPVAANGVPRRLPTPARAGSTTRRA